MQTRIQAGRYQPAHWHALLARKEVEKAEKSLSTTATNTTSTASTAADITLMPISNARSLRDVAENTENTHQPKPSLPPQRFQRALATILRPARSLKHWITENNKRRAAYQRLIAMDDRTLRDIGISRYEIDAIFDLGRQRIIYL